MKERPGLFDKLDAPDATSKPDHLDHRSRVKARFDAHGADSFADYELIELILFAAQPRRDMKPVAKRLLATFGDFNHAITAAPERLKEVEGVGDAVVRQLKIVEAAAKRLAKTQVIGRPVVSSWSALLDYCRTAMAHAAVEEFRLLFLDNKNRLIADELHAVGSIASVPVTPREVAKRALDLRAASLIIVHNHPSGDPAPSAADRSMTVQIHDALQTIGVRLHDHLIIGRAGHASFAQLGLAPFG